MLVDGFGRFMQRLEELGIVGLANAELAREYNLRLQFVRPEAVMIEAGIEQYFVLNNDGGKCLRELQNRLNMDYKFYKAKADGHKQGARNVRNILEARKHQGGKHHGTEPKKPALPDCGVSSEP